jgi:hypothetical protein
VTSNGNAPDVTADGVDSASPGMAVPGPDEVVTDNGQALLEMHVQVETQP